MNLLCSFVPTLEEEVKTDLVLNSKILLLVIFNMFIFVNGVVCPVMNCPLPRFSVRSFVMSVQNVQVTSSNNK